jgi:hypothetical protein
MFKFLVFVALVGAGGYFFPQVYEGTSNACTAIEAKAIRAMAVSDPAGATAIQMAARLSDGQLGRAAASDEYPDLPAGLACVAGYYNMDAENLSL